MWTEWIGKEIKSAAKGAERHKMGWGATGAVLLSGWSFCFWGQGGLGGEWDCEGSMCNREGGEGEEKARREDGKFRI